MRRGRSQYGPRDAKKMTHCFSFGTSCEAVKIAGLVYGRDAERVLDVAWREGGWNRAR